MLVSETAGAWQLIEQPDHAGLSGMLAEAWGAGPFAGCHPALTWASLRHDDGWSVWDRHPLLAPDGSPLSFLHTPIPPLLSSYAACVDAVSSDDPHSGLLASMHVSGLRRDRYSHDPTSARTLPANDPAEQTRISEQTGVGRARAHARALAFHAEDTGSNPPRLHPRAPAPPGEDPRITEFVAREERRQARLLELAGIPVAQVWHEYALLQLFDLISLRLCLSNIEAPAEPWLIPRAPTAQGAPSVPMRITQLGSSRLALEPWPFSRHPLEVSVRRRLLRRRLFSDTASLRAAWSSAAPETVEIELRREQS